MAVISVIEQPRRSARFGKGYSRSTKRVFRVRTDNEQDGPYEVGYAVGVSIGDPYTSFANSEGDPIPTCSDVEIEESESPFIWIVTCTYEVEATAPFNTPTQTNRNGTGGGDSDDPTQWEPKTSVSTGRLQLALRRAFDKNNNLDALTVPVVNSAGHPYSNPPMRNVSFSIVTHVQIEAYDAGIVFQHRDYVGSMNSIPWNSFDKWMISLEDWNIEEIYIGVTRYHRHTRTFWIAPADVENWLVFLLDAGSTDINGKQNLDPDAKSARGYDWPLNGAGIFLTSAQVAAGNHKYNSFRDKKVRLFQDFEGVIF